MFGGELEDGDGKALVSAIIGASQGVIEAFLPAGLTMVTQLFFALLRGWLGVASDKPYVYTPHGYVTLKRLFRQKARSNLVRMDALKDEIDWFQGIFLNNKTMIEHSDVYEAAGLSSLLNIQHDLALDQGMFFGAECILAAEEDNFRQIETGKCWEYEVVDKSILDTELCEHAARVLGHEGLEATPIDRADRPFGCYIKPDEPDAGLYLNKHMASTSINATDERQVLCKSQVVDEHTLGECKAWQQAGTWELGAIYALTNLGVLGDISNKFPDLRKTTLHRAEKLMLKYKLLLTESFNVFLEKRTSDTYFEDPVVDGGALKKLWCGTWSGRYVTGGRDYFYQRLVPGVNEEDGKCRGQCDVLSYYCSPPVRPEKGEGKYCVEDADKYNDAVPCFDRYKREVKDSMKDGFGNFMDNLDEFLKKVREA
jgi:hypothetical protein